MVRGAWTFLVESCRNPEVLDIAFPDLATFLLGPLVGEDPRSLQELMDGVGGNLEDVASLVMRSWQVLVGDSASTALVDSAFGLHGITAFTVHVDSMLTLDEESDDSDPGPLTALLLCRGIVETLTSGARSATTNYNPAIISSCLAHLARLFSTRSGYVLLPQAIRNGLLHTVVFCGARGIEATLMPHFPILLGTILPTSLAYYSVLAEMESALREVVDITSTKEFQSSAMFSQWQNLTDLAHKRLGVLKAFNSRVWPSLKACDNVQFIASARRSEPNARSGAALDV
ncbi:hypothetical protein C8R44DRAFT_742077 [Mycena epipterygia]|nr:hypothetical protein C8R44DRAFT_742077 [Mycena epipterygia]